MTAGAWSFQSKLSAADGVSGDGFGRTVSLLDNQLLITAQLATGVSSASG
jgi:hypothetical protein